MMTKQEIIDKITIIIRTVLAEQEHNYNIINTELNENTNLSIDLGMDSIEIITIIAEIEGMFDIEFDYNDMEIENITIFGNIVRGLEQALLVKGR